jgi:hypothetical protein
MTDVQNAPENPGQENPADEIDELDQFSRVALLIDDLSNEDLNAKLHSIQRLSAIAQLLGKLLILSAI